MFDNFMFNYTYFSDLYNVSIYKNLGISMKATKEEMIDSLNKFIYINGMNYDIDKLSDLKYAVSTLILNEEKRKIYNSLIKSAHSKEDIYRINNKLVLNACTNEINYLETIFKSGLTFYQMIGINNKSTAKEIKLMLDRAIFKINKLISYKNSQLLNNQITEKVNTFSHIMNTFIIDNRKRELYDLLLVNANSENDIDVVNKALMIIIFNEKDNKQVDSKNELLEQKPIENKTKIKTLFSRVKNYFKFNDNK